MRMEKQQKILYVITKSDPFGGAQRYVYELALAMKETGYEVNVAFGGSGVLKEKLKSAGIRTYEVRSFQRDISVLKEFRSFGELYRLYKEIRPDIVHLNSSKAGGVGALAARVTRVPLIVFTAHGLPYFEVRNMLWRIFVYLGSYLTVLLSHKTILVSEHNRTHAHMPFTKKKFSVVHTAVPKIQFQMREDARSFLFDKEMIARHQDDLWLVTLAELHPNKNHKTAIEAVATYNKAASQKIFYSILGDGELMEELTEFADRIGASTQVTFLGYIDSNIRVSLKAFDMFILPSKKEGLPFALLEAGAAGLPCIASDVGGIPEVIEHGKNGLLIDPNDVSSIIAALDTFAKSPELRAQCGSALQKKIRDKFSLSYMTEETTAVYEHGKRT